MSWRTLTINLLENVIEHLKQESKPVKREKFYDDGATNNSIRFLKQIASNGIGTFYGQDVYELKEDDDTWIFYVREVTSEMRREGKKSRKWFVGTMGGYDGKTPIFIWKNKPNDDPNAKWFIDCMDLKDTIKKIEEYKKVPSVRLILIEYELTLKTVLNTLNDSIKMTGSIGSSDMVDSYYSLVNQFLQDIGEAIGNHIEQENEVERRDREAVEKSLIERLEMEKEYVDSLKRKYDELESKMEQMKAI